MKKVFQSQTRAQGEAALEFAMALATGRMKLIADDELDVRRTVEDSVQDTTELDGALQLLFDLRVEPTLNF